MKEPDKKRIPLNISLYEEDLRKLNELSDKLGIKPSAVIRELIKNAHQSEVVQSNIALQLYQAYMKKCEERYQTSHNGQNVNDFKLKSSYWFDKISKSKSGDNTQINTNKEPENNQLRHSFIEPIQQGLLSLDETLEIARKIWRDD